MSGGAFEHLKALVVEDNQHMRTLLRSLLNALGITQVLEANDGEEAFSLLRDKQPDLILSDLSMTPMDGIAFVREVRTSSTSPNPYIPIIMVTGHTERHRVEAARDAGATEVLAKPITAGNLFQRIGEIVDRPRAFVKCPTYFGPDRRRHVDEEYAGPFRRRDDFENDLAVR
ncbi:MAG: response regulator [Proteobacteria bacterium]|nr:response regulator [Pseudomonadota bacterium]